MRDYVRFLFESTATLGGVNVTDSYISPAARNAVREMNPLPDMFGGGDPGGALLEWDWQPKLTMDGWPA